MTNNDIFKKLRVALQLRDDQIVDILQLVDFRISKGEIGNFFRSEDHPKYVECKDQVLRNFLNGLVIYLRGTKENPKNPMEVLGDIKKEVSSPKNKSINKTLSPKESANKVFKKKPTTTENKNNPLNAIKYNNGKKNKKAED
ncbi:MAG TPA: DUF1456 family protein [Flavobacterium sp.]|nr:DUF1456 family protein [Flavobacterium sp.]